MNKPTGQFLIPFDEGGGLRVATCPIVASFLRAGRWWVLSGERGAWFVSDYLTGRQVCQGKSKKDAEEGLNNHLERYPNFNYAQFAEINSDAFARGFPFKKAWDWLPEPQRKPTGLGLKWPCGRARKTP